MKQSCNRFGKGGVFERFSKDPGVYQIIVIYVYWAVLIVFEYFYYISLNQPYKFEFWFEPSTEELVL